MSLIPPKQHRKQRHPSLDDWTTAGGQTGCKGERGGKVSGSFRAAIRERTVGCIAYCGGAEALFASGLYGYDMELSGCDTSDDGAGHGPPPSLPADKHTDKMCKLASPPRFTDKFRGVSNGLRF